MKVVDILFDTNTFVLKQETLGIDNKCTDTRELHIAFGADDNYIFAVGTAITSIAFNNPSIFLHFYIVTGSISKFNKDGLNELASQYRNIQITVFYINDDIFKNLRTTVQWSLATYYRLILGCLLGEKIDNLLYLDADIICLGKLDGLLDIDLTGNIAAVVSNTDEKKACKYLKTVADFQSEKCFNAGVLFINLKEWNKENIMQRALDLLNSGTVFAYLDQDVLNIIMQNKVIYIDDKYNYQYFLRYDHDIASDAVLVHYITGFKPWIYGYQDHLAAQKYIYYKEISPWKTLPLLLPKLTQSMREAIKYSFRHKNYGKAVFWTVKLGMETIRKIKNSITKRL